MKTKLQEIATAAAEAHVRLAKLYRSRDDEELAAAHTEAAETHLALAKRLANAPDGLGLRESDDLKIADDGVRAVVPDNLMRLVPRPGQPTPAPDLSLIDPSLRDLVAN